MAYANKADITTWPHTPAASNKVPAGTVSPKAGWLGNLQELKEHINHLHGALGTAGHTHTGVDGDGPQIPSGGIVDGAVTLTTKVGGILPTANGGTGIAYFTAAGPTVARVYTFPDEAGTVALLAATQTLTNKTLTAPVIATISNTGTVTLPTATDTLVGRATTDTLTNKTLGATTLSGALSCADQVVGRPELKDYAETVSTNATSGAAATLDLENGNIFDLTLTANCTITISNPPATGKGGSFTLFVRQDATGSRTVTWPASVKWPAGTAPTLSTGASDVDVLVFVTVNAGTAYYAMAAGQDFA